MAETLSFRAPLVTFPPEALTEIIRWLTRERLAALLDVTDLRADTPKSRLLLLADWAVRCGCCSVCLNPVEVDWLPERLRGTGVRECYTIDFPLGKSPIGIKADQAAHVTAASRALRGEGPGHVELDMVINVGRFKQDPTYTHREIAAVVEAADGECVKVIIRSAELVDEEIIAACQVVREAGARFVKNSTGMDGLGATPDTIRLMRTAAGPAMGVKAAGGIRDAQSVVRLIFAGAADPQLRTPERFRIGASDPQGILATLDRLRQAPQVGVSPVALPCEICPSGRTGWPGSEVREAYEQRCRLCPHYSG